MKKNQSLVLKVITILVIYFALYYYGGTLGRQILYPVTLFVTFLHEFGHALGAIATGGRVEALQINPNGSGFTKTIGGNPGIILMGGYIGSAILGNLLFYIGARRQKLASFTLSAVGLLMAITSFIWFNSMTSTVILLLFAVGVYALTQYTSWEKEILMFFGLAAVLYIIQDFNVGPSSDLRKYASTLGLFSATVWKYIWLGVVVFISFVNLRIILTGK